MYISVWLKGYGESKDAGGVQDKAEYLRSLLAQLNTNTPTVVSPSMSGGFSIPLLTQHPEVLAGYVPVAPVDTGRGRAKYPELQVRRERERDIKYLAGKTFTHKYLSQVNRVKQHQVRNTTIFFTLCSVLEMQGIGDYAVQGYLLPSKDMMVAFPFCCK